jgi:flagellum-specific ATP synthase
MPLGELNGVHPGSVIIHRGEQAAVAVAPTLQGRVLDGLGRPLDRQGPVTKEQSYPLYPPPRNPLEKKRIRTPLDVGIRAINGLLTCGKGQRVGIFSGSGVGKSVLLGAIARHTQADVNVIALIGERGREVREFIERNLGEQARKKTVMVVATSDQPALVRRRGAFVATAIAEYFRDQGHQVLLMMDSLTRLAMAQREIGLSIGDPPTARGYTPTVFALLPKLLERVGNADTDGSITGLYTVLVENNDMDDPIAEAVRSIVDGHIVLSHDLASKKHYPAIDLSRSLSRVMSDITTREHQEAAGQLRELLAVYQRAEDLIAIGAYVPGSRPDIDRAISMIDAMHDYLRQDCEESVSFEESVQSLRTLFRADAV